MLKLFETYERCAGREPDGAERLAPIAHTTQQAQIEIVIDGDGNFRRARVLDKRTSNTMIPCTEGSGGRSGKSPINHPLCDKLQYIAADYLRYGGVVTVGFATFPDKPHKDYLASLEAWARSDNSHTKVESILRYVKRGCVVRDLIAAQVLPTAGDRMLKAWSRENGTAPEIFKSLPAGSAPEDAFVRWVVEDSTNPASGTWQDAGLATAWIAHYGTSKTEVGCCVVQGKQASLATQHPAKLRNSIDKAKLLSSNDTSGYTFRGRFCNADEALAVGFDVTQKAHNALRWLIARPGTYRHAEQVVVCWSIGGDDIPDPFMDSLKLTAALSLPDDTVSADVAQAFAVRLKRSLAGYGSRLDPGTDIVVMALDSTSGMQGRMAVSYYRELKGSEFLARIEAWHTKVAWPQNFGKNSRFIGAPAPRDIAEVAFGKLLGDKPLVVDDRLLKSSIERLLPCIVDGQAIPSDLVLATARRASKAQCRFVWNATTSCDDSSGAERVSREVLQA